MRRDHVAILTSLLLLAVAIVVWRDLFLFSKVLHLPAWTSSLPDPINTPAYLAALCLMPAAFISSTLPAAVRAATWSVLGAPLPALGLAAIGDSIRDVDVLLNSLFNYAWIVGFHCLVPAVALLAVRVAARVIKERAGG
jgi:hypothetical protein